MENPVIKKLRIKEGMRVAIINAPGDYLKNLGQLPKNVKVETASKGLYDFVHLFVRNKVELNRWPWQLQSFKTQCTILGILSKEELKSRD